MAAKAYSAAFKQQMVARLVGKNATSAYRLGRETGVSQEALSRWRREARSLPVVPKDDRKRKFSVEEKAEILSAAAKLTGAELSSYLEKREVKLAEFEGWRISLEDEGIGGLAFARRIKKLERELARKEKALAEAAAILILKKKMEEYFAEVEDEDTDEESEK